MTRHPDGTYTFHSTASPNTGAKLEFTEAEVAAFLNGITRGEFDRDTESQLKTPA